jgi:hypothetical protein
MIVVVSWSAHSNLPTAHQNIGVPLLAKLYFVSDAVGAVSRFIVITGTQMLCGHAAQERVVVTGPTADQLTALRYLRLSILW